MVTGKHLAATKSVPASVRRLTDKGNSTVTRVLEEAKNILVEDGFLGLSFRAIAKRTGTTVGNIGYYYGTKDDLLSLARARAGQEVEGRIARVGLLWVPAANLFINQRVGGGLRVRHRQAAT